MKIRRFLENEQKDLSTERVDEIMKELKKLGSYLEDKGNMINSLETELSIYKSQSNKGNDQVDDSTLALQVIKGSIDDIVDKLDTVVINLDGYNQEGRSFLYTENK